jgi:hypothetical protein
VLLIGIEADGDINEIIQATGSVATDTLPGDEPIDICQVFLSTTAFAASE